MKEPVDLLTTLRRSIGEDACWQKVLSEVSEAPNSRTLHLAILVEPYLTYILDGRKTIESRFSVNRIAPYAQLRQGDVILLKRSSGPVLGVCRVQRVWFYRLEPASWREIRHRFSDGLCAHNQDFWNSRQRASFATLIELEGVKRIEPIIMSRRDRRGWVILAGGNDRENLMLL